MNKRFIAFILVLLIAVGGVFAEGLNINGQPKVTISGTIGPFFVHGLLDGEDNYSGTQSIPNAFTSPNVFKYGFETNEASYEITMTVTDFLQDGGDGVVKIKSITANGIDLGTPIEGVYVLFSNDENSFTKSSTTITIVPAIAANLVGEKDHAGVNIGDNETYATAGNGDYEATITFIASGS